MCEVTGWMCGEFDCMLWDIDGRRRQLWVSSPWGQSVALIIQPLMIRERRQTPIISIIYSAEVKSPITHRFSLAFAINR